MNMVMTQEHDLETETSDALATQAIPAVESTAQRKAPRLGAKGLTLALLIMTVIPVGTVLAIWTYLPQVYEGQLDATASADGLPPADFYLVRYDLRPPWQGGELILTNNTDEDWSHLNIQVNGFYQIHDIEPIPAGESKSYKLEKFLTRSGARFQLQYNQLKKVRVYARLPGGNRATFAHEFETVPEE
jgi:hypothetical protein